MTISKLIYFPLLLVLNFPCYADDVQKITSTPKISIIIDDLGNHPQTDLKITELPGPVVCSVLPYRPSTDAVIKRAGLLNKPIILHIPMEPISEVKLGSGGLTTNMRKEQFIDILQAELKKYSQVQGVSNHMGSKLTQDSARMGWFMDELAKHKLFFVDSKTSSYSVAGKLAKKYHIPTIHRDIFLDNEQDYEAIDRQFKALIYTAKQRGYAVAIGHPYPVTLRYLQKIIPELAEQGVELVSIAELINKPH